ncbi:MAG: class I tRNA ligase family protein, partial [Candidatus Micrarchaeaceae archaeon]
MQDKYDHKEAEARLKNKWEAEQTYKFRNSGKPVFAIDTPPPTVSGFIHVGHLFSYSQADFIARFKRMRGYEVFYPFGFDNNG